MSVEESTPKCVAGSKLISITLHNAYHCGRVITIDGAYNYNYYYVGGVSLANDGAAQYIWTCRNTGGISFALWVKTTLNLLSQDGSIILSRLCSIGRYVVPALHQRNLESHLVK